MILNEGQGQYNLHAMHSHISDSHHAKFDNDLTNSFRGIACEGHTRTGRLWLRLSVNFFKVP